MKWDVCKRDVWMRHHVNETSCCSSNTSNPHVSSTYVGLFYWSLLHVKETYKRHPHMRKKRVHTTCCWFPHSPHRSDFCRSLLHEKETYKKNPHMRKKRVHTHRSDFCRSLSHIRVSFVGLFHTLKRLQKTPTYVEEASEWDILLLSTYVGLFCRSLSHIVVSFVGLFRTLKKLQKTPPLPMYVEETSAYSPQWLL